MLLLKEALGYGVMFSQSESQTAEFAMLKIEVESDLLRKPFVPVKRTRPELDPKEQWCPECDGEGSNDPCPPIVDCHRCNGTGVIPKAPVSPLACLICKDKPRCDCAD